jgi:hypothetical protein
MLPVLMLRQAAWTAVCCFCKATSSPLSCHLNADYTGDEFQGQGFRMILKNLSPQASSHEPGTILGTEDTWVTSLVAPRSKLPGQSSHPLVERLTYSGDHWRQQYLCLHHQLRSSLWLDYQQSVSRYFLQSVTLCREFPCRITL